MKLPGTEFTSAFWFDCHNFAGNLKREDYLWWQE
jgi:uncharacterized membrane protein YhaH (DUF805 family)